MRVIVGLGNPGNDYKNTRHNIGFLVIDSLAEKISIPLREGKGEYLIGSKKIFGDELILLKPLTFMNNSGIAVKDIVDSLELELDQLLIISDDFNLPLGQLRIRERGSSGGHNGLNSIIYFLGSEDFPRLRCGIATDMMPKNKNEKADYVLSSFIQEERKIVEKEINDARDAVLMIMTDGLRKAINHFNRKIIN